MIFTEGGMGAIESLMREVPGHNHYDDGIAGKYPECRKCRYCKAYQPFADIVQPSAERFASAETEQSDNTAFYRGYFVICF